ncbi:helix-turn-helix domain-containing protein [Sulfitobacter sp. M368]|uniref:helix-turn-helix domain-containing protein n=1 Tax=Sulfitobacter sp. M368 TaxID=2867021 RepID=UPI0021A28961|nr:helix-turn-helix domain-containing protein [Sulfitobacter sp. M368]UWR15593.1 helix-turn-helix domain-containing protein [Sulfitobacter sp. M368]
MEALLEGFSTPRELANASGWPEKTIRSLIATNELRHLKLKQRFFVPDGALEEFIKRRMVVPESSGTDQNQPENSDDRA